MSLPRPTSQTLAVEEPGEAAAEVANSCEPTETSSLSLGRDDTGTSAESEDLSVAKQTLSGLAALVDQGFVSFNTFATLILVAKLCPRADLNVYALAWTILCFFRVVQERLLAAPYFVFAHQPDRNPKRFLGSSLIHQICFATLSGLLFIGLAVYFSRFDSPAGMSTCMWICVVATPLIMVRDHLRTVCCANFRYGTAVAISGAACVIQLGLIFIAYWLGQLNVYVVFAAMAIASALPALAWFAIRPITFEFNRGQTRSDWKSTFDYSKWLVAARFFPTAASCLLPFIVLSMVNEDASGVLVSCISLANLSLIFVTGANNYFQPRAVQAFHQSGSAALCKILLQSAVLFSVVLSALCVVYLLFGDQLLSLIFREDFVGNGSVVAVLGVYTLIVSLSIVAGNGMAALEKPKGLFWGEVAFAVVTIGVAFALTPSMGITGAAVGLVCGATIATLVAGGFFYHLLRQVDPSVANGSADSHAKAVH